MKLRQYQRNASESTVTAWDSGIRTLLGVMPTGCGKTIVFSDIVRRRFPKRAMVLAHRQELIWQARDKIQRVTGFQVDVEMGEHRASNDKSLFGGRAPVVVSTVQTHVAGGDGGGRIGKFDPADFGLLIIDEAHHATAASYRRIIDYYMTNEKLVVLGVTATADRSDEEALGQVFEQVAFDYEILDMIKDGWLVPVEQQMVNVEGLDFSAVKTTAGDLNGADLAALMESEKNLHGVAGATIDIVGDRRGIGFAASVEQARVLSMIFNRHKRGMSGWVSGATDKDERAAIIRDFAAGKIQWLWNCAVFTEGFDDAGVEVISMGRPTKSRSLYAQMAGRATRPAENVATLLNNVSVAALRRAMIARSGKPSCLIIDFVGNSGKHKLMTTADVLGGNVSDAAVQRSIDFARNAGKAVRMDKTLEEQELIEAQREARKIEEEANKRKLVAKATYKTQKVDAFDIFEIAPVKSRGWDNGKELSPKQRNTLKQAGYDPDAMEYARAKQLVGIIIDRYVNKKCTIKQAKLLKSKGWTAAEVEPMTFEAAHKAIDQLSKNGWQRPVHHEAPEPAGEVPF